MVESGGVGCVSSRFKAARVGSTATTIFAEMSALAIATDSVNLGQGFPDYDGPAFMLETAERAIADGRQPVPARPGITPLRQAVVDHSSRHYGLSYDADTEVVITTGATEALASAILAFVDPGDEVIALEPFYDSYAASVALAGGRIVGVGVFGPDFTLDLDELRRAVSPRTKMILVNSPHNPTGAVLGRDELSAIADLAIEHDLLVVCDEVYEHLVFDDVEHLPLAAFPGMRERTIRISSSGKTFSATGWKIGWALGTGPADHRADRGEAVPDLRLGGAVPARDREGARTRATSGSPRRAGSCRASATGWPPGCARWAWSRRCRAAPTS